MLKMNKLLIVLAMLGPGCDDGAAPTEPVDEGNVGKPGRYKLDRQDLVVRVDPKSYAIGRLHKGEGFDLHSVDANGWAWGFAYGDVNRCVWVQFHVTGDDGTNGGDYTVNFDVENPEPHNDQCKDPHRLPNEEWTNGTINDPDAEDGTEISLNGCAEPHHWDNWDREKATGVPPSRGLLDPNGVVRWRYVTPDGQGVMSRIGEGDWVFIPRSCFGDL